MAAEPDAWTPKFCKITFGAFIPVGIRIGLDARERLKADAHGLTVTYHNGEKPPRPCVADGIMIASQASPGQGTLHDAAGRFDAAMAAEQLFRSEPAP